MTFFLFLLLPLFARAESPGCPTGYAMAKGNEFYVQVPEDTAKFGYRNCRVKNDSLADTPMQVVGCRPQSSQPDMLVLRPPKPWAHECFGNYPQKMIRVIAADFELQPDPVAASSDCGPQGEPEVEEPAVDDAIRGVDTVVRAIQSFEGDENGFKNIPRLERYHRCLLNGKSKREQYENYMSRYRDVIEYASESFTLPMALLTCSCGRESMFDSDAVSSTNVTGICQNTAGSLSDVSRWIKTSPAVRARWKRFTDNLGDKIEFKSCLKAELNQNTVKHCPSLGLGAAALYFSYLYKVAGDQGSIGKVSWDAKSIETLIALASVNNVGPARAKALRGKDDDKWAKALLKETCKKDGALKFREVRSHMLALYSCLRDDSWLDHQGMPLGGECAKDNTPDSVRKQREARDKFESELPTSCK